jgi:hypothetical protein
MIFVTLDTVERYRRATEEFAAHVRLVGTRWTAAPRDPQAVRRRSSECRAV